MYASALSWNWSDRCSRSWHRRLAFASRFFSALRTSSLRTKRIRWKRNHLTSSWVRSRRTTRVHGKKDPFPLSIGEIHRTKERGSKSPVKRPTCAFSIRWAAQDASPHGKNLHRTVQRSANHPRSGEEGPSNGHDRPTRTQLALHRRKRGVSTAAFERFRG